LRLGIRSILGDICRTRKSSTDRNDETLERGAQPSPSADLGCNLVVMAAASPWFVYLARCRDGTLYCGVARDVAERIAKHDAGKGARYTRGRGPLTTLAVHKCRSHGDALRLELAVKRLSREAKEALAEGRRFRALQRSLAGSAQQRKPVE
jgi:putative endonuclease